MKRNSLVSAFVLLSVLIFIGNAHAKDIVFFTSVDNLSDETIYTVPAGKKFILGSVIIGNSNASDVCCARMYNTGIDLIYVGIPAYGSFQHVFKNVVFKAGEEIQVRNGASSGFLHFTVTGSLVPQ